uniref:PWWP domain-containing protein n=1 Tax=Anopheles epiroticus TaxID=199890 RepID=A0A182PSP6_9DIPT
MSNEAPRKTPTSVIAVIWNIIINSKGEEIEHERLVKQLYEVLCLDHEELAELHVLSALSDELIAKCIRPKQRGRQKLTPCYTLPDWRRFTVPDEQPDICCYECHIVGNVVKCDNCVRSFHESCLKTIEEKQLELEQFVSKQKRITISSFKSKKKPLGRRRLASATSLAVTEESTVSSQSFSIADSTLQNEHDDSIEEIVEGIEAPINSVKHESIFDETFGNIKLEEDVKESLLSDEAMFVCMVRPPNRRLEKSLNTPAVKPEQGCSDGDGIAAASSTTNTKRFCHACHLLQESGNHASPNVLRSELNYLLYFVVEQYKSWIPKDTFSSSKFCKDKTHADIVLTRKTIEVCLKMLLRVPTSLADVQKKIENDQYGSLEEFHVDLLDMVHNVAIIHGESSMGYNAAMFFLADCVYDLREIRQCPDCYRHSTEKVVPDWFARPCRTRHELVFAKQKSYQYWPAKVVRVVNNRYDVRFFGGNHPRALIDAESVKPIDSELRTLGVNDKHRGFQLAMKEMLRYQSLAEGSREQYAFTTACEGMQAVANRAVESIRPPEVLEVGGEHSVTASRPKARKRNQINKQPSVIQQSVPLAIVSPSSVSSDRASRSKRREMLAQQQATPVKRTRSSNQTIPHTPDQESPEPIARRGILRQIVRLFDGNHNGLDAEPSASSSTRAARANQNNVVRFPETYDTFRLKQLLDQVTDLEETKQIALKLLQHHEEYFVQKLECLKDTHDQQISAIKRMQWVSTVILGTAMFVHFLTCVLCEEEARIPCCWNTSYCTADCQERHWSVHRRQHLATERSNCFAQSKRFAAHNGV